MLRISSFRERILSLSENDFEELSLDVFRWQADQNPLYRDYLSNLHIDPVSVQRLEEIPFLPIEFFKRHQVKTGDWAPALIFESSGTTGSVRSRHLLDQPAFYDEVTKKTFEALYGPLTDCHFLALLPSYLERTGSSLIHMIRCFIDASGSAYSGFYLDNTPQLLTAIDALKEKKGTKVLWGVTFALLDLAGQVEIDLSDFVVMETGGMKGRRREMVREEVHEFLKKRLNVASVHSEYGMTELLSQAYATQEGHFAPPPWMRILVRDINDPFTILPAGKTGGINVIDLANLHSCCFVETADLGKISFSGNEFEILGRYDNSDVRGCNLLIQ